MEACEPQGVAHSWEGAASISLLRVLPGGELGWGGPGVPSALSIRRLGGPGWGLCASHSASTAKGPGVTLPAGHTQAPRGGAGLKSGKIQARRLLSLRSLLAQHPTAQPAVAGGDGAPGSGPGPATELHVHGIQGFSPFRQEAQLAS